MTSFDDFLNKVMSLVPGQAVVTAQRINTLLPKGARGVVDRYSPDELVVEFDLSQLTTIPDSLHPSTTSLLIALNVDQIELD